MEKTTQRKMVLHFAAVAMTAIMSLFVVSNGVAYALTGETWVESAIIYVNDEPTEMDVVASDDGQSTEFALGNASVLLEGQDLDGANITVPEEAMDAGDSMHIMLAE